MTPDHVGQSTDSNPPSSSCLMKLETGILLIEIQIFPGSCAFFFTLLARSKRASLGSMSRGR